jgi:nucleoside phosphorylase
VAVLASALLGLAACGDDDGNGGNPGTPPARIAVLSAFPAELAAVLERTRGEDTMEVAGRNVRIGTLGGKPVVVAMTGVGLVNAANSTRAILEQFPIRGVVVSGVAGSSLNIADVAAVTTWTLPDGSHYDCDPRWLRVAGKLADARSVSFNDCAAVTNHPEPVCLPNPPVLVVGGEGESADPFGGGAFPCHAGTGDIYGCDAGEPPRLTTATTSGSGGTPTAEPLIQDMESAAIAREAAAKHVPFIAFRAVSDGAGDPLNLPGFPAQFYAYYHLAANNAAAVAEAFVKRL